MTRSLQRAAAALLAALALAMCGPPAMAADSALWTAPSGDGTTCTQAEPCPLLEALRIVDAGGTVYLTGGVYPPVSGPPRPDARGWTEPAVVAPAPGADAQLTRISLKQPHVTLRGVHVGANPEQDDNPATPDASLIYQNPNAFGLTIEDSLIEATGIMVRADDTRIIGNVIDGLRQDGTNGLQVDGIQVGNGVTGIQIIGNTIRGARYEDFSGYHPDCLHIFDAAAVVVRWNHLSDCGNAGLIFSGGRWGLRNVLVEGNFIGGTLEARAAQTRNLVIRYNTVSGSARLADPAEEFVTVWDEQVPARSGLIVDHNVFRYLSYCNVQSLTNSVVQDWNRGLCGTPASGVVQESHELPDATPTLLRDSWAVVDFEGDRFVSGVAGWDAPPADEPPVDPPAAPEPPVDQPDPEPTAEPTVEPQLPVDPPVDPPAEPSIPPLEPDPSPDAPVCLAQLVRFPAGAVGWAPCPAAE